jgi:hypothetical protein
MPCAVSYLRVEPMACGLLFRNWRLFMNRSKLRWEELEQVLHELRAINVWDRDFFSAKEPDLIESAAWEARRLRILQIFQELFPDLNRTSGILH